MDSDAATQALLAHANIQNIGVALSSAGGQKYVCRQTDTPPSIGILYKTKPCFTMYTAKWVILAIGGASLAYILRWPLESVGWPQEGVG